MAEVVIAEFMDEAAVDELRAGFQVHYDPTLVDRQDELIAALADARGLIVRNRTQVRGALLAAATRLEAVGRLGVGLDNIDLDACRARGIVVLPATGANAVAVAEYVLAAALTLLRPVFAAGDEVLAGAWPRERLIGRELAGRRLGLLGFGAVARELARRAQALGMTVAAHDPFVPADDPAWAEVERRPDLEALVAAADMLSLHVPLTEATRGLLDACALARLPAGAIVINTARGGIVDELALVAALRSGALGGAALDVFAREPLTAASASLFAGCPNLLLTPHVAGVTEESNLRVSLVTARSLAASLGARGSERRATTPASGPPIAAGRRSAG
jgi:(S)-sulfolactate dehydrogenase